MSAFASIVKSVGHPSVRPDSPAFRQYPTHPDDMEFLAADLEIIETPPSPIRKRLILTICAFVSAALVWAWIGRIDIVAVAQGKIKPQGNVKVIQPLEAGRVASIDVENGQRIKAGDVLIEMDPADAKADELDMAATLAAWRAETVRRRAAIDIARRPVPFVLPKISWPNDVPASNRSREEQVLSDDIDHLSASLTGIGAQIDQKAIERDGLDATIASQRELIDTLQLRVDIRGTLVEKGAGSKVSLIDALERVQTEKTTLKSQIGQRDQADANLKVLDQEKQKSIAAFIAENSQKLADAKRQVDDYEQRLVKTRLKSGRLALTSPIDGVVMGLSVTTAGQVLSSGEEVMRIVPRDAKLEIEAYLANKDVAFVKPGQKAVIKLEAFPFLRYGTILATVDHVALDAIPEPDAQATEGDPTKANRSIRTFAGAQRVQNLVFPVKLTPDRTTMTIDGEAVPLTPGMAINVEITTGSRRILEYLFSPLIETASEAFKER
jgi:hemolysin D